MRNMELRVVDKLNSIKRKIPIISRIRINFITLHYVYIIAVAIVGSIILFPGGGLSYTDALFFSTGSATQSGLNPVDVNNLLLYQQIWLYFGSMIANPIVIHSSIVVVRLYWFEKRFLHVVREAKKMRRTKSRSRSGNGVGDNDDDNDANAAEMGVRGRKIEVLRDSNGLVLGHPLEPTHKDPESSTPGSSDSSGPDCEKVEDSEERRPDEDPVSRYSDNPGEPPEPSNLSVPASNERHIEFLENQRRQKGALRIPSPREYDRGGGPQTLDDDIGGGELGRRVTTQSDHSQGASRFPPSAGQHITIDEPEINRSRRASNFPRASSRQMSTEGSGDGLSPAQRTQSRVSNLTSFLRSRNQGQDEMPYLSWQPTIGRNSAFVDLTEEQRNELGGIEYRALKTLAKILAGYFIGFHLLGIVCLVPWIMETDTYGKIVMEAGQGRPWWAVFSSASSFNDQGFAITPDSMISFGSAVFPVLLMTFLIIIGNTAFPCMLRLIIWVMWKLVPNGSAIWEELHFLLDHPRRCFTLLFPRAATWWLFGIVVLLNGIDLIFFIILDLNDPEVSTAPVGARVLDGLFQAAATRTAGLSIVNMPEVHPATQVSYMVMMYISVYPIAISLRRTNVYEERSLGIYSRGDEEEGEQAGTKEPSYVGAHLRKQLSFDLWYIFLGLFLIAIVEGSRLDSHTDIGFNMFSILFEIVSAYGTVGLSLGYPGVNTSFSGQFRTLSKLIIVAMEIRGRHRGLPYELDRAVLLPSEALHKKEAADASRMRRRSSAGLSTAVSGESRHSHFRPGTGLSTSQQQRYGPATPEPGHSGETDTSPGARIAFANSVKRMPTHQEKD